MKDLTSSSAGSREACRQNHKDMPWKEGRNKEGRRRRPNKQDFPPLVHDEAYVHTPWLSLIPERQYVSAEQRLHDEIVAYTTYMQPTAQENRARQMVLTCIQGVVGHFLDGEVNLFGSCATGLWLPTSDIDIAISTPSVTDQSNKSVLFQLSSRLKSSGLTPFILVNHHARVPILKFTTRPEYGALNVDIGINNTDGVKVIELINGYLANMPALRPLVLVVKGFLAQRSLNDASKSGLGSYAVILMCISFLQVNPSNRAQEFLDQPMETQSLGLLLTDFLFYYALEFPYTTSYVSVTEGKVLPKTSADWIKLKNADRLAIQCLVNSDNDVGKSLNSTNTLRRVFKEGYAHILQLTIQARNTFEGLVAVNSQTIAQRARNAELFGSSGATVISAQPWALYPRNVPPKGKRRDYEYGRDRETYTTGLSYGYARARDSFGAREKSWSRMRPRMRENRQ